LIQAQSDDRKEAAMSWEDAHRYNAALRAVETELNWDADGEIHWRPEYADIFGSPHRLLLALRSRWETMVHTQISDDLVVDGWPSEEMWALATAHPGMARALARAGVLSWLGPKGELVASAA
jgi:hypothetical protein